jgi:LysM repeat protein
MTRLLVVLTGTALLAACAGSNSSSSRQTVTEPPPPAPYAGATAGPNTIIYDAPSSGAYTVAPTSPASAPTPETSGPTVDYVVKGGDSLWKIARDHGTTVVRLRAANGLSGDVIRPGQVLKVPAP